jgi:hypothetical protein
MKQKTSLAVRRYLVSVYITQGLKAAKPLATKYGYHPRYLSQMARAMLGRHLSIYYKRNPFVEFESYRFDPRFTVRTTNDANFNNDPPHGPSPEASPHHASQGVNP